MVSSKGREQSNTEIDSSAINRHQPSGGERLDIVFDGDGVAWVATPARPSTMGKVVEVTRRGAPVLELVEYPSVMTRGMVRRATRAEVDQWRDG